jgi:hypothetical protein
MDTAAAYMTIAAFAAIVLDAAIATGMACRSLGRRLAVLCRHAPLVAVAASAAVIVLALGAPLSPPAPFAPGLRPAQAPPRATAIGNGMALLAQQGYPPSASAVTQRHGTPGQIQAGS